jgi:hypothetical protein
MARHGLKCTSRNSRPCPLRLAVPSTVALQRGHACLAARHPARQSSIEHTAPYRNISHPAISRVLRDPTRPGLIVCTSLQRPAYAPSPDVLYVFDGLRARGASLGRGGTLDICRPHRAGRVGTVPALVPTQSFSSTHRRSRSTIFQISVFEFLKFRFFRFCIFRFLKS